MRCPCRLVLDDHQTLQRHEIVPDRLSIERAIGSSGLRSELCRCDSCCAVSCQGAQEAPDTFWITPCTVDAGDVCTTDLVEIVANGTQRLRLGKFLKTRPPADRDAGCEIGECQSWVRTADRRSIKDRRK